jgi:mannose-6-phosphate isomerase-like protein (cupin superfamily)
LTVEDTEYRIGADDVVYIPAGMYHSLSNTSSQELVIYEIYAPAGGQFDFVARP